MPRGEPTRSLPVRFTEAERERLEAAAGRDGVSVSEFVRRVALWAALPASDAAAALRATSAQERVGTGRAAATAAGPSRGPGRPAAPPRRPVHAPTCRCAVCVAAKGKGKGGKRAAGG